MTTVAIIQARMGSSRLPGKVLMNVCGKPMLQHVIERTLKAIPEVIVATSFKREDDAIEEFCRNRFPVRIFRGAPTDVLGRFIEAALEVEAEKIIRITGDCPLIDPAVILKVSAALAPGADYASNVFPRTYPKGLDCEAVWFDVLLRLQRFSTPDELEHVTAAIRRRPEMFCIQNVADTVDRHTENWSVDTQEDLERVRKLHAVL